MSTNSREAFEAWREKQPWYAMSKPDPDDPEDDGATHRLMNIAASEAWTASRQQAMEEAAAICTRKAEGIARVNTYRGKVNAASQHAIDMVEDCAAALREAGKE